MVLINGFNLLTLDLLSKKTGIVTPTPIITSISPNFSVINGGSTAVITGTNFTGATVYSVNNVQLTSPVITSTTITGTIGVGSTGLGNVVVTTPGGTATLNNGFTYLPTLNVLCVADMGTTIATGVSQWNDLSGNGNNFTQGTGAKQPALISSGLNSLATIRYNGTNQFMTNTFSLVGNYTYWIVFKMISYTNSGYILAQSDGSGSFATTYMVTPSPAIQFYSGGAGPTTSSLAVGTFGSMRAHFATGANASDLTINNGTPTVGTLFTPNISPGLIIASLNGSVDFGNIEVAAILCGAPPVSGDVTIVENWLRTRWNLY